jgi:hypothetical protein
MLSGNGLGWWMIMQAAKTVQELHNDMVLAGILFGFGCAVTQATVT